ncbi:MAG: hypothetical protein JNL04_10445 [Rhodospirillaceae bacterium]|nr:hypothetical protein [Rhodospirillaceae bacterium]
MPKSSLSQQKTAGRVMHEFKHGELKSGPGGKGGKVKSRKQAIAIALSESGSSKDKSKAENRRSLAKTKRKEARGETAQQEKEGKSHVGARGQRESSRAMGGKDAKKTTKSGERAARSRVRDDGKTKAQLYARAKRERIPNRSKLTKQQLENALAR